MQQQPCFCILVTGSPTNSQANLSAMRFCKAVVKQNYQVAKVFFYQEATHVANQWAKKPSDENQLAEGWSLFAEENNALLEVCITAAERRGIISSESQSNTEEQISNLHPAFSLVGLAQLVESINQPHMKLVHFK
jgi:tRNA 2-thiouridine synthesizing protein D